MRALARALLVIAVGLMAPSARGEVTSIIRIHQPYEAISYNRDVLEEFKVGYVSEAAAALGIGPERLSIALVAEGTEVSDQIYQFLPSRRRAVGSKEYKGGTVIIHLRIADGSPSSEDVYNTMVGLVEDSSSVWYQGEYTGLTDPGVKPTNNEAQSVSDKFDGRLPMGLIFPVGFAPLGLMFAMYFIMVGASKRKAVEGERKQGGSKFKEEQGEGAEDKEQAQADIETKQD